MISDYPHLVDPPRTSVQLQVANLTETERDVLLGLVAVLSDPALAGIRKSFLAGRMVLEVDDGIPTWTRRPA